MKSETPKLFDDPPDAPMGAGIVRGYVERRDLSAMYERIESPEEC